MNACAYNHTHMHSYGLQLMIHSFDGIIEQGHEREDGQFLLNIKQSSKLFTSLSKQINVLLTHGDLVKSIGNKFTITATSENGIISAAEYTSNDYNLYGVQFHPEVDLTPDGKQIFTNFLFGIAHLKANYTMKNRKQIAIEYIQKNVGNKKVLCLVSGGVDSSVCCALLRAALNDNQIYPVHINTGFMRENESLNVEIALKKIGINILVCEAMDDFLNGTTVINDERTLALCKIISPEIKRKIIGDVFMKICDKILKENYLSVDQISDEIKNDGQLWNTFADEWLLAQGTLRPDLIESASKLANKNGTASVIKTHHNDTYLVRCLRENGKVIEPLTDYHKDEVRKLGRDLGLPNELVMRQPFPGPGLAIRIICCQKPYSTANDIKILQKLKTYENENIKICLFGFQTVGVQGDGRTYAHCVGLFWSGNGNIPWNVFYELAKKIPRVVRGVNRCIFVFGESVSGVCTDITPTFLVPEVIQQLRKCDTIVNDLLAEHQLMHSISQVPVILFPSNFGRKGYRSVCIRTFMTNDFMTGVPAVVDKDIPETVLNAMVKQLSNVEGIARVAFDLTPKPPGTTEWE